MTAWKFNLVIAKKSPCIVSSSPPRIAKLTKTTIKLFDGRIHVVLAIKMTSISIPITVCSPKVIGRALIMNINKEYIVPANIIRVQRN